MKPRKTWREKLAESKDLPKTLVIPAPKEVDAIMRQVPAGRVTTINEIRQMLARQHHTTTACPMTTGIFAWIAAHAAAEAAAEGQTEVTPYWRTLKTGGELNAKYPGGSAEQRRRLAQEGHRVLQRGSAWVVADYEKALWTGPA
jgi:alkylated DNA nucleotide flippase Atl1